MTTAAAVSTKAAANSAVRPAVLLAALGVVFGDIGTSPIYAFRESLKAAGNAPAEQTILGVLSLVFWAVLLVVALKYVVLVMRADNQGEGGTMALLSLALPVAGRLRSILLVVGLLGASLFFGDAMITPAISVLSAIEGLELVTPVFKPYVIPIACGVLVGVFSIQSRGSGRVGKLFGPVMMVWFATLGLAGLWHLAARPAVLAALNPLFALQFLTHASGWSAFTVLGSVFLALTGGEALYADMGHFGRDGIRLDWFVLVMPALVLNYFGQGALVLSNSAAAANPFFLLFGPTLLVPVLLLATAATVIASQAVISGAFALVQQAIQLGALPRMDVRQTSDESAGQVYVPQVNWLLAAAVLALVVGFGSSESLANAYGIAVAGDMLVTSVLVATVARELWQWPWSIVAPVMGCFLLLDLTFVSANIHKIPAGGWFPLLVAAVALTLMLVWRRGRAVALAKRDEAAVSLEAFAARLHGNDSPYRTPGTGIYLTDQVDYAPRALMLNLRHNGVVQQHLVLLKVATSRAPRVPEAERVTVRTVAHQFQQVNITFGFAEKPDVPAALTANEKALGFDPSQSSYFLGRENPVPSLHPDIARWQERIYAFLAHNAVRAPDYFLIPASQVVELGTRVEM
jgi:KUP system potassium uptake protein